jgi:hypothetical protein
MQERNFFNLVITLGILLLAARSPAAPQTGDASTTTAPVKAESVTPSNTPAASAPADALPGMQSKPQPAEITFLGCPPEGDGGDPALNKLKNRVDEGNYASVTFDALEQLPWPKTAERRNRAEWSASDTAAIARYEGIPVSVEGYLADAKESGPESCNCHGQDPQFRDWHIWLTKLAGEDRTQSIVVETTPRVRAKHPDWKLDLPHKIIKEQQRVRISGWVMFDPEHPDQVGKTRGTIWEIHPIMQIEVQQQGKWVTLDSLAGGK